jgi:hypothetical protein
LRRRRSPRAVGSGVVDPTGYSRYAGRSRSGLRGIGGQAFGSKGVPQFSGSSRDDAIGGISGRADTGGADWYG